MTTTSISRYGAAALILCSVLFCFCSRLGESTGLGSGIINDVDPGKADIDKHFRGLMFDSSFFLERFSVPFRGDSGFGYHSVSSGNMILGKTNNEHSVGYFEVVVLRDSLASTRVFVGGDTLKSLKAVFTRDSVFPVMARQFDLYRVYNKNRAFDTVPGRKLGTIAFSEIGTASKIDTIDLLDTAAGPFGHLFCDSVFYACSTFTTDALKRRDTLRFVVVSHSDANVLLKGSCTMILSARRPGADTLLKVKTLVSSQAWYIVAEDGNPDTLKGLPVSSFASKRTAVYKYRIDTLWRAIGDKGVLISAGFLVPNKTADSVLAVRGIVRPDIVHDGTLLDSLFAVESSILSVKRDSAGYASVAGTLQKMFNDGSKPSSVYLYVRYTNATSEWKTVTLDMNPSLKAMITNP